MFRFNSIAFYILLIGWLSGVVLGLSVLYSYANSPGLDGCQPTKWPTDCQISLNPHGHTLVMFVHPRCPCSRASLIELMRIHSQVSDQVEMHLLFFQPDACSKEWTDSELHRMAERIPDVRIAPDECASTAMQFGARTSGHVVLYDAFGRLCFSGGITASRGHEGENSGGAQVVGLVLGTKRQPCSSPVFGCSLFGAKGLREEDR